jgi:hypothetical protein
VASSIGFGYTVVSKRGADPSFINTSPSPRMERGQGVRYKINWIPIFIEMA